MTYVVEQFGNTPIRFDRSSVPASKLRIATIAKSPEWSMSLEATFPDAGEPAITQVTPVFSPPQPLVLECPGEGPDNSRNR